MGFAAVSCRVLSFWDKEVCSYIHIPGTEVLSCPSGRNPRR